MLSILALLIISLVLIHFKPSEKFPLTSGFVSRETVANVNAVIVISGVVQAVDWKEVGWRY